MAIYPYHDFDNSIYSVFTTSIHWFLKTFIILNINTTNFYTEYLEFYELLVGWLQNWTKISFNLNNFCLDLADNVVWDTWMDDLTAYTGLTHFKYYKAYTAQLMLFRYIALYHGIHDIAKITEDKIFVEHYSIYNSIIYPSHRWLFAIVIFGITFFLTYFGIKTKNLIRTNSYAFKIKFLTETIENNWGAIDDAQYIFIYFMQFFIIIFLGIFLVNFSYIKLTTWIIVMFVFLSLVILSIPMTTIWNCGIFLWNCLRGSSSSNNKLLEFFLDHVALLVLLSRFLIQNIRVVIIFATYFELYEYFYGLPEINNIFDSLLNNPIDVLLFFSDDMGINFLFVLSIFSKILFYYLFYFLHFIVIFYMQSCVFYVLTLWLYFFLYNYREKRLFSNYFNRNLN